MQSFQLNYTDVGYMLNEQKQPFDHLQAQFLQYYDFLKKQLEKQTQTGLDQYTKRQ